MAESIGEVYVEIKTDSSNLKNDFENAKKMSLDSARSLEETFQRAKVNINTNLLKQSFSSLENMHKVLKAKLEQKIEMKADVKSIERTQQALSVVETKLDSLKIKSANLGNVSGGNAPGGFLSKIFGSNFDAGFGKLLSGMAATVVATFTVQKAFEFLKGSVEKFEDRTKAIMGLESILKSTGKDSELTANGLSKAAISLAAFNKYSIKANDVMELQGYLLTFDNLGKESLPRATQVVIDLAAKMKTDLKSAALSVGIALDNPEEGLSRLGRAGIKFTKDEKDVIKAFVETGDAASAQEFIFDKLEKKIGGYARNTTTALEAFNNKVSAMFGNIQRGFGSVLVNIAENILPVENNFTEASAKSDTLHASFNFLATAVEELGNKENRTSDETKLYTESIAKLQEEFPNYFKNMDLAKMKYEDIMVAIKGATKELDAYTDSLIRNAIMQDKKAEIEKVGKERYALLQEKLKFDAEQKNGGKNLSFFEKIFKGEVVRDDDLYDAMIKKLDDRIKALQTEMSNLGKEAPSIIPPKTDSAGAKKVPPHLITKDEKDRSERIAKERIKIEEDTLASINKLEEAQISDEYQRKLRALDDDKKLAELKLKNTPDLTPEMRKQAQENIDRAYTTGYIELQDETYKKEQRLAEENLAKKIEFETRYINEVKQFEKQMIDARVRNYEISVEDYSQYLDRELALLVESYKRKNEEIEKFNKNHPESKVPTFNIATIESEGKKENKSQIDKYSENKKENAKKEFEKNNKFIIDSLKTLESSLTSSWSSSINEMLSGTATFSEGIKSMFAGLKTAILNDISEMIAKWLEFMALKGVLSLIPGGAAISAAIHPTDSMAHFGGSFTASGNGVHKMANGGSFIVPPGYNNDSFRLMVESGEKVNVIPKNALTHADSGSPGSTAEITRLIGAIRAMSYNLATHKNNVNVKTIVDGSLKGKDIYLSNKQSAKFERVLR